MIFFNIAVFVSVGIVYVFEIIDIRKADNIADTRNIVFWAKL